MFVFIKSELESSENLGKAGLKRTYHGHLSRSHYPKCHRPDLLYSGLDGGSWWEFRGRLVFLSFPYIF